MCCIPKKATLPSFFKRRRRESLNSLEGHYCDKEINELIPKRIKTPLYVIDWLIKIVVVVIMNLWSSSYLQEKMQIIVSWCRLSISNFGTTTTAILYFFFFFCCYCCSSGSRASSIKQARHRASYFQIIPSILIFKSTTPFNN